MFRVRNEIKENTAKDLEYTYASRPTHVNWKVFENTLATINGK